MLLNRDDRSAMNVAHLCAIAFQMSKTRFPIHSTIDKTNDAYTDRHNARPSRSVSCSELLPRLCVYGDNGAAEALHQINTYISAHWICNKQEWNEIKLACLQNYEMSAQLMCTIMYEETAWIGALEVNENGCGIIDACALALVSELWIMNEYIEVDFTKYHGFELKWKFITRFPTYIMIQYICISSDNVGLRHVGWTDGVRYAVHVWHS